MKVVLSIISVLVAMVTARPDASHTPSGSYLPVDNYNNNLGGSGSGGGSYEDQKHVYFYAAPNDDHHVRFRVVVEPKSHKNSKIIFVKAPSFGGIIPEIIAPPSTSEDKTLVYVLTKNPLQSQSVTVPVGLGVKQHKPEVFFIKYNNKNDAAADVSSGVQGQQVGVNVPSLPDENTFVNTLGNGQSYGGSGGYGGGVGSTSVSIDDGTGHGPAGISGPY
ncbi:hypothetical protein FQA39_LY01026 [Lamprigera yunnana]|nr:hypothetical protein FQA39_LY01026 [Lamprigera yunnana]